MVAIATQRALALSGCITAVPRNDRAWYPYLSQTPHVAEDEAAFFVRPVSDWRYEATGPISETRGEVLYRFEDLREVAVEPAGKAVVEWAAQR